MLSLAAKGKALRQVIGGRLVCALADNDFEGRALHDDGHVSKGGVWKQLANGVHWCLLPPTSLQSVMTRFRFPPPIGRSRSRTRSLPHSAARRLPRAYAFADHKVQSDLTRDPKLPRRSSVLSATSTRRTTPTSTLWPLTAGEGGLRRLGHRPRAT